MGVVVVASLTTVGAVSRTRRAAAARSVGPMLAERLLAEVVSMPYEDPESPAGSPGIESGEASQPRSQFDDLDDYDDWDRASPESRSGDAISGYGGWRREVDVWFAERLGGNVYVLETGLKRIRVRVTSPDGIVTERFAWRWRRGSLEQPPTNDLTAVTWVGVQLQVGEHDAETRLGTNLINHAADPNSN